MITVTFIAPSINCPDRSDYEVRLPVTGPAYTTSDIVPTQTLLNWYRKGDDAQRRLPILSTFLGHAQVTDTCWYLTGTPRLLGAAAKRLEKRWEGLNAGR